MCCVWLADQKVQSSNYTLLPPSLPLHFTLANRPFPLQFCSAAWLHSPIFICLADFNCSNINFPIIEASSFNSPSTQMAVSQKPLQLHHLYPIFTSYFFFCSGCLTSLPSLWLSIHASQDSLLCIHLLWIAFPVSQGEKSFWLCCTTDLST